MILMWSCPGNMPKYYPGLRHILPPPPPFGRVICLSDLGSIYRLIHGHFHIGLVIIPRCVSGQYGSRDDNQANMEMPMY